MKISFSSKELEKELELSRAGTEVADILDSKKHQSFWDRRRPVIWTIEQVIDQTGERLLT